MLVAKMANKEGMVPHPQYLDVHTMLFLLYNLDRVVKTACWAAGAICAHEDPDLKQAKAPTPLCPALMKLAHTITIDSV